MNKQYLVFPVIIIFLMGSFAYGETKIITTPDLPMSSKIVIPAEAREYSSDSDLIEVLCYEAKWKGGAGVAQIEALDELISPSLNEVAELNALAGDIDLGASSQEMRQKLEAVCQAPDVDLAIQSVSEYISFAENLRVKLQGSFTQNLRSLENDLRDRGEKLKNQLEEELGAESERLAQEAETELRKKAEAEGVALESQLRQLAVEFEVFMSQGEVGPGEAGSKARQLAGQVSADSQTRVFLSSKFEEILNEAANLIDVAMSGDMDPAQIKSMAMQKVPGVVEEIKAFMKQKYENIAVEEEARIRAELEVKASEIGQGEKEDLEKIRDSFDDFEQKLENLVAQKSSEWDGYEQKALEKKRDIIVAAIDSHFEQAKKIIEEKKEQIDMAIEEGVAEEYGIKSFDSLISEIEKDRQEIISEFQAGDFSAGAIAATQKKFQNKWKEYRLKMEAIEIGSSAQEAIQRILDAADWKKVVGQLNRAYTEMSMNHHRRQYAHVVSDCERNPHVTSTPRTNRDRSLCSDCMTLPQLKEMLDEAETIATLELRDDIGFIERSVYRLNRNNPELTLKQVIDIKNQMIQVLEDLKPIETRMNQMREDFVNLRRPVSEVCKNLWFEHRK